jgi:hypothetical protein
MGELKIQYSDKKATPFGGMKLLKDFIDTTNIIKDLESVNIPQPQSNAGINPIDIIQGFWLSIFTGASRYIHADWLRYDTVLQNIFDIKRLPSQTKMVANGWMRSGNTADLNNYEAFLNETFNEVLKDKEIGLVRADSGFYSNNFLKWFEDKKLMNYIVSVKFYENIKYQIGAVEQWTNITYGLDVCNMYFQPEKGEKRRHIIVRKKLSKYPNSGGKLLFDEPTYRYSAYVTNLTLPVDQIYNIYNTRADCENRIKELKYDFGGDNFCLKEFFATEASFRFIMMAYNIMALFKHQILNSKMQLKTLRSYCFALGSWITNHANEEVLNISLPQKRRDWMNGLFDNIQNSQLPYKYPKQFLIFTNFLSKLFYKILLS